MIPDAAPPSARTREILDFARSELFDRTFRETFADLHWSAARRERESWIDQPESALALFILLDQYPRNSFRNTGHMYATDPLALHYRRRALAHA